MAEHPFTVLPVIPVGRTAAQRYRSGGEQYRAVCQTCPWEGGVTLTAQLATWSGMRHCREANAAEVKP
ncbi:hypothetical protein [Pseudonocardia xishanensis]|uniref:Uncharacterized protein n=1 Tax=Pseudonocardia xishanensis TaxID=630995 RepID=A0ABP8RRI1_9PSEU